MVWQLTLLILLQIKELTMNMRLPKFPLPIYVSNANEYLRKLVYEGAGKRYGLLSEEVQNRIETELKAIESKNVADYFLIMEDIYRVGRNRLGITFGPGRASAPGSIVNYSLGITQLDPLKHGLLFERFYNLNHKRLPDISTDCNEGGTKKIFEYLVEKYGKEHVSWIGTRYKDGSIRRDPCGIAISDVAISEIVPMTTIEDKEYGTVTVTNCETDYIEDTGIVKLDFLDFKIISFMDEVIAKVKENHGVNVDLSNIDIEDKETLDLYATRETGKTVLFNQDCLHRNLLYIGAPTFEDLTSLCALYLSSATESLLEFFKRQRGAYRGKDIEIVKDYNSGTYGMTIYQEQLMRLTQLIAGFTPEQSDDFRRTNGKRLVEKLDYYQALFYEGGTKNGYTKPQLRKLWNFWIKYGNVLFIKSHTVAYTLLAFQTAWLKAHFPEEYMEVVNQRDWQI